MSSDYRNPERAAFTNCTGRPRIDEMNRRRITGEIQYRVKD